MDAHQYEEYVSKLVEQLEFCRNAIISRNRKFGGKRQPGEYEIDIAVEVTFGNVAQFLLIVECKNWARPIDRPVVQKLAQTRDAIAAHKAAIASPVGFTKEAIQVAEAHGIALWVISPGHWSTVLHRMDPPKGGDSNSSSRINIARTNIAKDVDVLYIALRDAFLKVMGIIASPPLLEVGLREFHDVYPKSSPQPPFNNFIQTYSAKPFLEPGLPDSVFNPVIEDAYLLVTSNEDWRNESELEMLSKWGEVVCTQLKQFGVPEHRTDGVLADLAGNKQAKVKGYLLEIAESWTEDNQFDMKSLLDKLKPFREDLITNSKYSLLERINAQTEYERSFWSERKYKPFLMSVEDVFSREGLGLAFGEIINGMVIKGAEVDIVWEGQVVRSVVVSLGHLRTSIEYCEAGAQIGVMLQDMKRDDLHQGMVLAEPGSITAQKMFEAEIYMLTEDEADTQLPLLINDQLQFYLNGALFDGTIHLPEHVKELLRGESLFVNIELQTGTAIYERQDFGIYKNRHPVGVGRVDKVGKAVPLK
jgi:hypothetical protein